MRIIKVKNARLIAIDNNGNEIKVSRMPMRIDGEMDIPEGLNANVITIKNNLIVEDEDLLAAEEEKKNWQESEAARINSRQSIVDRIIPNFRYRSATLADLQELLGLIDWTQG